MKFEVADVNSGEVKWSFETFTEAYYAWKYEIDHNTRQPSRFEIRMDTK